MRTDLTDILNKIMPRFGRRAKTVILDRVVSDLHSLASGDRAILDRHGLEPVDGALLAMGFTQKMIE